jgi:DNA polymerase elongation subunit (family B)
MSRYPYFLVFDIETVGLPLEYFDDAQQEYLLRGATTEEEQAKKVREFSLSALTAKVACMGIMVMEWKQGEEPRCVRQGALILDETMERGKKRRVDLPGGGVASASDEETLLQAFWKIVAEYFDDAHLVSFNGKEFDAPFLMLRSAALRVRPSRKIVDIDKNWDKTKKHIDLLKELTFYAFGANVSGAARKYNFDFYARAFGIPSPKSKGVHGGNVAEYYAQGRVDEIAEYCMRDVHATWELFRYWKEYLDFSE